MTTEVIDIIIRERGGRRVKGAIREIGTVATTSAGGVQLLRNALRGLGVGLVVREVLRAVDSYQRMQNQLRVVGYETDQLAAAQTRLFNIAQATRVPLEETVNLYGKLAQSAGELGKTQDEMMRFTELTGKALAIQGTNTQGTRAALLQLSQAMGEGIVRAQEYNSLIENARPLLLAAAQGMDETGGSVAKLRTMVLAGTVTSTAFFEAVLKGGKLLDDQFGKTVPTIGQALTKVRNAFTQFMGESAAGQAILASVAGVLILVANNFELIGSAALFAGAAFALYWGSARLTSAVTVIWGAVRAQQALNVALGATGRSAGVAAAGLKIVRSSVRLLTVAIAANPLGALLVAALALGSYLFTLRDRMIQVGNTQATLGSIVSVVWDRALGGVKTFIDNTTNWFHTWFSSVSELFTGIGVTGKQVGNFLIAVFKSFIDVTIGNFRTLFTVAVGVLQGIAKSANLVSLGLQAAISGQFALAGDAFEGAFDGRTFDFSAATESAAKTAAAVGNNFGRDFLGEAGAALDTGKAALADKFQGVMQEAAARDALSNLPIPEFEFATPTGAGGASGGGGAAKLNAAQKRLKEIIEDTAEAASKAQVEFAALTIAYQQGAISADQYAAGMQDVRLFAAQAALENVNLEEKIRGTNEAILQLKVESGGGSFADGFLLGLARMTEGASNFTSNTGTLFSDFFSSFSDGFANSVGRAIVYSEDLGTALHKVGNEAIASLISGLVKMGVQWVLNATIGQAVNAAATAATVAQAGIASSAWAAPAALASLATGGANAIPANAAVAATLATTKALSAAFADGGRVFGPGGPRDDKVLARLSDGEFVINAASTKENLGLLEMINAGANLKNLLPAFANGGRAAVGTKPASAASPRIKGLFERDVKSSSNGSRNAQQQTIVVQGPAPNVVVKIGASDILDAISGPAGDKFVIDAIERKKRTVSQVLQSG